MGEPRPVRPTRSAVRAGRCPAVGPSRLPVRRGFGRAHGMPEHPVEVGGTATERGLPRRSLVRLGTSGIESRAFRLRRPRPIGEPGAERCDVGAVSMPSAGAEPTSHEPSAPHDRRSGSRLPTSDGRRVKGDWRTDPKPEPPSDTRPARRTTGASSQAGPMGGRPRGACTSVTPPACGLRPRAAPTRPAPRNLPRGSACPGSTPGGRF